MKRNLGAMRQRILLKTTTRTKDAGGGFARSDPDGVTISAQVKPMSAGERMVHGRLEEQASHKIIARYRDDIKDGQTIHWLRTKGGPLQLYVVSVEDARPERPGEWLQIIARQGTT